MKTHFSFPVIFLFLFFFILTSCTKTDSEPDPSGNARDKFLGTWSVHETHNKADFPVTILADPNEESRVLIDNFGNLLPGNRATAVVSGNSITLDANQPVGDMTIISGSGNMPGTTVINWTYSMTDGATRIDAVATFTKN